MNCTIDEIKDWLKENLTQERYEHSIGTAECARDLALRFNLDSEKAYLTGLIHDCAKCLPKDECLKIITSDNLYIYPCELVEGEIENVKTHHAPGGICVAQKTFGIEDKEILSAIRWHTLGKVDMTDFEKIIFLADKIESRTRPQETIVPILQELKHSGLDKALLICYKNTIKSLVDRDLRICKTTIDIYNSLIDNLVK